MNSSADTIDLADVFRTIRRGWRAVIAFTALGALAAVAVILLVPPRFAGSASIVLRTGADPGASILSRLGGVADAASGMFSSTLKAPMETELQILSSKAVVGHVVDLLRLQARVRAPRGVPANRVVDSLALKPAFKPARFHFARLGGGPQYRIDGADMSVTASAGGPVPLPVGLVYLRADAPAEFELQMLDREDVLERMSKRLKIDKKGGEVASIDYRGDDSLSAAAVPNAIVATYLARRTTTDRGTTQYRVAFLAAQVDSARDSLAASERALRRQQEASGVIDPTVVGKIELERASQIRGSLTDLQIEDGAIRQLMKGVSEGTIQPRELAAYPTFLKAPAINSLITDLAQTETERYKSLERLTEKDPEVIALTRSATNIEAQLLPLARTYSASIAKQRVDLEGQFDSLQQKIASLPATAESGLRLQRDVKRHGEIFGALSAQLVQARLAAIAEGGDVRALDAATPPKKPAFPNPILTAGVGIAGGFAAGLLLALLNGALGRWVQDPAQIERSTGVPALAFDPVAPLLIGSVASQTVLVLPIDPRARAEPVVKRLVETALSRSISATVLDLSSLDGSHGPAVVMTKQRTDTALTPPPSMNVNASIERLEQEYGMVIVQLPGISAPATAAALRPSRPVVLVAPERRIDRASLMGAVQTLRRLDVPCAGIVLSGVDRNGFFSS